jgi:predicted dehydrogenase
VKVALIGRTGHAPQVLEGIKAHGKAKLVGFAPCCKEEEASGMQKKCKDGFGAELFDDWRKMLDKTKPDVAGIAPWFCMHTEMSIACFERGISPFPDKPVSLTLEDLEKLKIAYEKRPKGVHFTAMHAMRYDPPFRALYQVVKSGRLGTVTLMTGQKSYKLKQRAAFFKHREKHGGLIPWVGSHAIDWFHWYAPCGFASVYGSHTNRNNFGYGDLEISAIVMLTMENGGAASANIDYRNPDTNPNHGDDRIRIAGDKGVAEVRAGKALLMTDEKGPHEVALEPKRWLFKEFLDQIEGNGKCLLQAEEVFRVTETVLKARQAADEGRVIKL